MTKFTCPCCGAEYEVSLVMHQGRDTEARCICLLTGYWGCPIHGARSVPPFESVTYQPPGESVTSTILPDCSASVP